MRYVIIELAALTALAVCAISCGHRNGIPESLKGTKEMLDDMHKRKIDMADGIIRSLGSNSI